ncbi:calmodulin-binding protein 60 B-like isoform X2 [Rhododendron vialii]|uniref:calmodulin-binding protein 60 B-like isoform X2 n=1 Tax=Rhododendron vialii TaxID=182163 RepID=UPI00266048FB|nr:calmodulin-binding protein 60 B-like isoform X2 [Rhododendron vialii]
MYVIDDFGEEFKLNSEKFKSFQKRVFHIATSPDLHPDTTPPLIIKSTQQEDDVGSDVPRQESKRQIRFAAFVGDAMRELSLHEFATQLEPVLRTVVREEVERAIVSAFHPSSRTSLNQSESSKARVWQLHFVNKFRSTLFTGCKIESEDHNPVKIVIRDSVSGEVISSGPLSSLRIEIVVLNGDFGADYQEDWTEQEFNANLVREREGKRPLVTGELVITLRDGVGYVGDVSFTDNSSWIRSRKFRLGARPVQSKSPEVRIREARSEAFVVKDHRGEAYKKHHPPNLNDEVWRLEKISKGGTYHKALRGKGITTVEQFLQSYSADPSSLRLVLGGMSNKIWETVTKHATACVLDDKLYIYYKDGERIGVVFNSIFRVVGATFDGQSYQSLDLLNEFQMGLVENLKRHAYKNLHALVLLDAPPAIGPAMLPSSLLAEHYSSSSSQLQDVNFPVVQQDQMEMQLPSSHMATAISPSYSYNVQYDSQPEDSVTQLSYPMQLSSPTLQNSFKATDSYGGSYDVGNGWAPVMQITHLTADDNSQVGTSTWQGNGFLFSPVDNTVEIAASNVGIRISMDGKPKSRWCTIRAAVKWVISVRRDAAAKRMERLFSPEFVDYYSF